MTETFRKKGEGVYKAEAVLPPMPKKDACGRYGDSGLPPQDWNEDPLLKEKPRTPDVDVSTGDMGDAHVEQNISGEPLSFSERPDMAADEVKSEWERHKKRRVSKPENGFTPHRRTVRKSSSTPLER